jgi:hypothetical protein
MLTHTHITRPELENVYTGASIPESSWPGNSLAEGCDSSTRRACVAVECGLPRSGSRDDSEKYVPGPVSQQYNTRKSKQRRGKSTRRGSVSACDITPPCGRPKRTPTIGYLFDLYSNTLLDGLFEQVIEVVRQTVHFLFFGARHTQPYLAKVKHAKNDKIVNTYMHMHIIIYIPIDGETSQSKYNNHAHTSAHTHTSSEIAKVGAVKKQEVGLVSGGERRLLHLPEARRERQRGLVVAAHFGYSE